LPAAVHAGERDLLGREKVAFASRQIAVRTPGSRARMDPAMRALALRHDPRIRQADLWARPPGWGSLDITQVPTLGEAPVQAEGESAEELNSLRPFAKLPIRPMRPFVLAGAGADRARAVQCLTQAVYYESAREPEWARRRWPRWC
jgi:hypothetical protein